MASCQNPPPEIFPGEPVPLRKFALSCSPFCSLQKGSWMQYQRSILFVSLSHEIHTFLFAGNMEQHRFFINGVQADLMPHLRPFSLCNSWKATNLVSMVPPQMTEEDLACGQEDFKIPICNPEVLLIAVLAYVPPFFGWDFAGNASRRVSRSWLIRMNTKISLRGWEGLNTGR